MENLIVAGILLILIVAAVLYIYKEKKKGARCIGCSSSGCCSYKTCGSMNGSCKCHNDGN